MAGLFSSPMSPKDCGKPDPHPSYLYMAAKQECVAPLLNFLPDRPAAASREISVDTNHGSWDSATGQEGTVVHLENEAPNGLGDRIVAFV